MYVVRDIFTTKPGKAKELVNKFKQAAPYMKEAGYHNTRTMTDVVSNYWTVVIETEVDSLAAFEKTEGFTSRPEVKEIMKGYMDLVKGGHREIFKVN
jgi:heme-degrading monooxygenase HmoA